jgi:hypothetical protein
MSKLTLDEMETKLTELSANYEKKSKELDEFKAEVEKKAEDAKKAEEAKKAAEEDLDKPKKDEKNAKFHKAMKAAMEEKDETKKAAKIAEAMTHYKAGDDEEEKDKKDDKDKEAMKAELTFLRKEASKPRLQFLEAAYKGRVDDKELSAYKANWEKSTVEQLDAEISKVKPFVKMTKELSAGNGTPTPISFSTIEIPTQFKGSVEDTFSASLEKLTPAELFGGIT